MEHIESRFRHSSPILLIKNGDKKELSIPSTKHISKSWDESYKMKPFDAISNCKSAGIIPYTIHKGTVYFLLQKNMNENKKKNYGWNDFGGKRSDPSESTADTAAREFNEETSCLFYFKELNTDKSNNYYNLLKNNNNNTDYPDESIKILKSQIPLAKSYFSKKITKYLSPLFASSKEIYISYFVKVNYVPSDEIPVAEDIHIPYQNRYLRTCKWFTYEELMALDNKEIHKRLQITKIKRRITNYYQKELFT